jgi:hypothetical protein
MPAKLPRKFFPEPFRAKISFRKVGKWEEVFAKRGNVPYFNTWEEARDYMGRTTMEKIKRLECDLARERRHLVRVESLVAPE